MHVFCARLICIEQGGDTDVDYRRGKRYKKLTKLLGSGPPQAAAKRYHVHTYFRWFIMVAGFVACYAVLTQNLDQQVVYYLHLFISSGICWTLIRAVYRFLLISMC